jgi:outer membrane protein assembly factor BamC
MKSFAVALLIFSAINLGACRGNSAELEYLDSRVGPNLEIPPDLTLIKADGSFELPAVFTTSGAETRDGLPVLASVDSIQLKGHSDYYWLSIDEPADNLYRLVKDFWASEGYTLAMDEPAIGIMETNWIFNKEGSKEKKSFLAKLFGGDGLSESQDQFKTRIARDDGTAMSQVYISHRGTGNPGPEYSQSQAYDFAQNADAYEEDWKIRVSESELEVEMLSRLMLYLGLRQLEVDQQLAKMKLFPPRASIHTDYDEDETYILVKDEFTRAWYRTLHQLERLNFEIISADIGSGLTGKKGDLLVETDIEVEVDNSGFFSFTPDIEIVKKQIKLVFSEESPELTRINMKTDEDDSKIAYEEVEFLTLLYQYIK